MENLPNLSPVCALSPRRSPFGRELDVMLVLWTVLPVNRETREGQHQAMETHMFSNTVPCEWGVVEGEGGGAWRHTCSQTQCPARGVSSVAEQGRG